MSTDDEDRKTLAEFSTTRGAAYRLVVSQKEDIARWIEEGWSTKAIYHLLKTKGMTTVSYVTFRRAVAKVLLHGSCKMKENDVSKNDKTKEADSKNRRPRPHEMNRESQQKKFMTMTGMDHIGLNKKDD